MDLNKVQVAALRLMQSDARFLYTLVDIHKNAENITSNYIMMCQPYIGIFVDGAEQWCKKVGLVPPSFTAEEKVYYTALKYSLQGTTQGNGLTGADMPVRFSM